MRYPLRLQILLPFVLLQVLTVTSIAAFSSWLGLRQVEADLGARLHQISTTLGNSTYPLTESVLDQLASLTGAELILWNDDGQVVRTSSSLSELPPTLLEFHRLSDWRDKTVLINEKPYIWDTVVWRDRSRSGTVAVLYPEESIERARWGAIGPPVILACVLVALTVVTSFFIAGSVSRRVDALQSQAEKISSGDFQPQPVPQREDELQRLAITFNTMAVALEQSRKAVQESERSRLLTQLIGGLAHQLRNAITGARISIQLHQRRCAERSDVALERALSQMTLTEEQIKALLRITRGESRTPTVGDVAAILGETLQLVAPIIEHHRIELKTELSKETCRVDDADAIRAAVVNLLMNAIEATGPEGKMEITSRVEGASFLVDLSNSGQGISPEVAEKLFSPFFSTKPEGVGLGLTLARQSVEDCRGTLNVFTMGEMTTFRITLPHEIIIGPDESESSQEIAIQLQDGMRDQI